MDSDSESKLVSLISQLITLAGDSSDSEWDWDWKTISLAFQIISLVRSMDLDSQPKPESKLMSLVTQTVSLFNSMDFDSLPKPLSKLISVFSQEIYTDSDQKPKFDFYFKSLVENILDHEPDLELISLIRQIFSVFISMNSELKKHVSLCPRVEGWFDEGNFRVVGKVRWGNRFQWNCLLGKFEEFRLTGENATHFRCKICNGEYHKEYEKAPLEIKHPLHPKHSLQLVLNYGSGNRECYCCDEDLKAVFYYCSACEFAINIACTEKPRDLSKYEPKWHEHKLALFPSQVSLPCNVCALTHSTCPFYICPPCDFVVHQKCIGLPRVIRICRHPHRISLTPSFNQGDWSCRICRKKINNDYGGFSCIKNGCTYVAHSRCATQSNVWDGKDLDGKPEETEEEEVEPFLRISDRIIRHFSHEHHHLRLDENTCRDYDENKQCQACITPIYFGNLYSCVQCEFVLHEKCANLYRKLYYPIHPHPLSLALVGEVMDDVNRCSTCFTVITYGFFYECGECNFKLHVQCATLSEPLDHKSHVHSLFLTSKPGERRGCSVCLKQANYKSTQETFNCIKCNDFSLCLKCAAIPEKVRYKHDKHILTLSYGYETSSMTYWCEACERKIKPYRGFYICDE